MENNLILEKINGTLSKQKTEGFAIAYGLSEDGENLRFEEISRSVDVYDLINEIKNLQNAKSFDYLSITTWGWAAPLSPSGDIETAPSKHPEKRRVQLIICGSNIEKDIIGSCLNFQDTPNEPIYDTNDATGMLKDAFVNFFEEK